PLVAGAGGFFAPYCRAYVMKTNAPAHIGPMIDATARATAGGNESAHRTDPMTVEDVTNSLMLWEPIRYLETCPSSDGAIAMVLGSESAARKAAKPVAWIKGAASYAEAMWVPGRDQVSPEAGKRCAKHVYDQAGIRDPWNEIQAAEIYV